MKIHVIWKYMTQLLHILLEWIGLLLPWICIVSLAWIQSFFKVSVVFEYFFVPCHPNWWASVLSRSFVHWRRPVPYFYFYTQVVLGFVLFCFIYFFSFFFFRAGEEVIFFNIGIHDQNLFSTWELDQHLRFNRFLFFIFFYYSDSNWDLDQHLRVNIITFQISFKFKLSFKRKSFDINDPTRLENIIWIHSTLWIYFLPIQSLNLSNLELLPWRSKLNQLYYRRRKEFNLRN